MANKPPAFTKLMNQRDNFLEEVTNYCLLGASDKELGEFFGLSEHQVRAWSGSIDEGEFRIEEFYYAVEEGRSLADARVAKAMHKRAMGYEYDAQRLVVKDGHATVLTVTEHVPPDTNAAKFWLTNRAKRKWKDRQQLSHVGADGDGPVQTEMTITFVAATPKAISPPGEMIDVTPTVKPVLTPANDE